MTQGRYWTPIDPLATLKSVSRGTSKVNHAGDVTGPSWHISASIYANTAATVVWYVVTVDIIWRVFPFLTDVIFYLIENRLCTTYLWNLFAHWYLVVNYKCDIPPNSQNPELFGCMIVATLYFMKNFHNFDFRNLVFYKRSKISFQICGPLQHFARLCPTC